MNLPSVSKSADYYSTHMDEAEKKMSECIGTPKMKSDEECKAAFEGLEKERQDKIKQHP